MYHFQTYVMMPTIKFRASRFNNCYFLFMQTYDINPPYMCSTKPPRSFKVKWSIWRDMHQWHESSRGGVSRVCFVRQLCCVIITLCNSINIYDIRLVNACYFGRKLGIMCHLHVSNAVCLIKHTQAMHAF